MNLSATSGKSYSPFALALSGGGARGFAHVIALEVLDELGIKPDIIAGSSIGAIIGVCYAAGMSGRDIRAFFVDLSKQKTQLMTSLASVRIGRIRDVISLGNPLMFDGKRLLERFWPQSVPRTFEELPIPVRLTATDFYASDTLILQEGDLLPAIAASIAIPGVFAPVRIDGRYYVDGGILCPVPFDIIERKLPVLAIDVVGAPQKASENLEPAGIQIFSGSIQLMQNAITAEKLKSIKPDIFIQPPIHDFSIMDFLKVEQILAVNEIIKDNLKHQIEEKFMG